MLKRDPKDRRYRERLAGSYLASIIFHALLAAFVFAVIANSSQEGAVENVSGGELITLEQRAPVVAQVPVQSKAAAPQPHAPRIAPLQHAPVAQPAHQQLPQNRHELAKFAPTAPPNPRPIPQASVQPNPQPTQAVLEPTPQPQLAAVPTAVPVPTNAPVAIVIKAPPTAAPTPAPTAAPTATPKPLPPAPTAPPTAKPATPAPPAPTVAPTAKPATPAPPAPTKAPTAAPVIARATVAPTIAPAAAPHPSPTALPSAGVPSPNPSRSPEVAKVVGTAPSPGAKAEGSPGPRPGVAGSAKPAPPRPVIAVNPTPSPAPKATATPSKRAIDLNAKLRSLLPSNPVNVTSKEYREDISLNGRIDPTPPPEVVANTKYMYESTDPGGNNSKLRMWVAEVKKVGPVTMCVGWLVRYPGGVREGALQPAVANTIAPANGTQVQIGGKAPSGSLSPFSAGQTPIVEEHANVACNARFLTPFVPSPAPSP